MAVKWASPNSPDGQMSTFRGICLITIRSQHHSTRETSLGACKMVKDRESKTRGERLCKFGLFAFEKRLIVMIPETMHCSMLIIVLLR